MTLHQSFLIPGFEAKKDFLPMKTHAWVDEMHDVEIGMSEEMFKMLEYLFFYIKTRKALPLFKCISPHFLVLKNKPKDITTPK